MILADWKAIVADDPSANPVFADWLEEYEPDWTWLANYVRLGHYSWNNTIIPELRGHSIVVSDILFNCNALISASYDGTICFWDTTTGVLKKRITVSQQAAICHMASVNDESLVVADSSNTIRVISMATGEILAGPRKLTSPISAIAVSPDGNSLAVGRTDNKIVIFDTKRLAEKTIFTRHTSSIRSIFFNDDGSRVLSCDWRGWLESWDAKTGLWHHTINIDIGSAYSMAICRERGLLAVVINNSIEQAVLLLDYHYRKEVVKIRLPAIPDDITFSRDGKHIVVAGRNMLVYVIDVDRRSIVATADLLPTIFWHIRISDDMKLAAAISNDRIIRLINMSTLLKGGYAVKQLEEYHQ